MTMRSKLMQIAHDTVLEQHRRQKFLESCNAAYAVLQQNPDAGQEYQDELRSFEGTLRDGLDFSDDELPE